MDTKLKNKLLWATVLSIVIMPFLLFKVDWAHFTSIADRIDIKDLSLSFAIFILANFARALRFHKIDHVGNKLFDWCVMNHIYNFNTATLPGGAGEAVTAYLIKRFSLFNMLSAVRILVLSRLMDITGLSAMLFLAAILISETTSYREVTIWISGIVFIVSIIITNPRSERLLCFLLQKLPADGGMVARMRESLEAAVKAAEKRFSKAFFGITLLLSVLTVFGAALSLHFLLSSFGTGFVLMQSMYCYGVYALFQVVPIQGIAGIGTQAAWWSLALTAAGYQASDAIAIGILLHAAFYVFITVTGLFALLFWLMGRKKG